jgi:hypothetical protein
LTGELRIDCGVADTGTFNTTLTATFFSSSVETETAPPADVIIPISARNGASNQTSAFVLPTDNATNTIGFPQNVNRAVFTVSANGQASEEFWWSNVLESDTSAFSSTAGTFTGWSPFREVQVFIDGQLAGVWWPFPVIFTGGVVPSLHRPIVGLEAFDLLEHEIDITPWLAVLCDGAEHTFTIQVAGLDDDGQSTATLTETVNSNWVVTGKIFVWLDDEGSVTTGTPPSIAANSPAVTLSQSFTQNSTGFNETLSFSLAVQRTLSVTATINSQNKSGEASWSQTLLYSNDEQVTAFGYDQINNFLIHGIETATSPSATYSTDYEYPLYCNETYYIDPVQGNITLKAHLIQGLEVEVNGNAVFPTGLEAFAALPQTQNIKFTGSLLNTSRDGTASFFQTGDGSSSSGFGSTNQVFHFGGLTAAGALGDTPDVELFFRNVTATNGTVVYNDVKVATEDATDYSIAAGSGVVEAGGADGSHTLFAAAPGLADGIRAFMGRGGMGRE